MISLDDATRFRGCSELMTSLQDKGVEKLGSRYRKLNIFLLCLDNTYKAFLTTTRGGIATVGSSCDVIGKILKVLPFR